MANNHTKDVQDHELQIKAVRYLSEWPKPKTLTTPNTDEDVEQQELSFIADGNSTRNSCFANHFGSFL